MTDFLNIDFSGAWEISPQAAANLVRRFTVMMKRPGLVVERRRRYVYWHEVGIMEDGKKVGTAAVLPVNGELFMYDQYCGNVGMKTLGYVIDELAENSGVDMIVLEIDSPGGEARGSRMLGESIARAAEKKPVMVWCTNMLASAAYKISVGATAIYVAHAQCMVGSIGTRISYFDFSDHWKKEGIDFVDIVSAKSPMKNRPNFMKPTEDDRGEIRDKFLEPLTEAFHEFVLAHRDVNEKAMNGDLFYADEAIEYGLIDGVKSSLGEVIIDAWQKKQN